MEKKLLNKKIAIIIAFRDFRDREYFEPKAILAEIGAKIITFSSQKGIAVGADGGEVEVDMVLNDLKVEDYDAVLFVGGPGALKYLDNEVSYEIARGFAKKNKILAAICIAPTILAKAGVLFKKKATVWSSSLNKNAIKILEEKGAIYLPESVVIDGNIITADGPESAKDFGRTIGEKIKG